MGEFSLAVDSALAWAAGVGAIVISGVTVLRKTAKGLSEDIPKYKEHRAHGEVVDQLRAELQRMEDTVIRMQGRLTTLEEKHDNIQTQVGALRADAIIVYGTLAKVMPTEETREHLLLAQRTLLQMATQLHPEQV